MAGFSRRSFVESYRRGRRDFRGVRLRRVVLGESNVHGDSYDALKLQSCDFTGAMLNDCSFVGSDLTGSRFAHANLSESNFARATLARCNFDHASLIWCNLNLANCSGAKLTHANLNATKIWRAVFSYTLLTGACFDSAALKSVLLTGADAAYLTLDDTVLTDLDLSVFANARITKHEEPSDVDWRSVAQSLRLPHDRLKAFLVTIGMPDTIAEWMIEAARALDPLDLFTLMQSTFISYGVPDEKFAIALRDELHKNGVTTFLFRDNAVPGQKLHHMMRSGVNNYDRVILICSKASLDRTGVLNEIEETLQREARDGGASYLIPIRLDDYVFAGWNPPNGGAAQAVRDRVVGDFRVAKGNKRSLVGAIRPLLDALKKRPGKTP